MNSSPPTRARVSHSAALAFHRACRVYQRLITRAVTIVIVDRFKVIEIDRKHGEAMIKACGAFVLLVQLV